ncbi:MAG: ABC transporter permease [Phycisphaerae bacterium]|nr:ABC transporter permease [Phycisphaerae bacterium]
MTSRDPSPRPRPLPAPVWPALGILTLIVFNALSDTLAPSGPGLLGPGAFLHVAVVDGAPAGALIDILHYGGAIAILALGMAPVIATRGVDLSVGAVMAIAAAAAARLSIAGTPGVPALAGALAVAGACGLWNGVLVVTLRLQPFVATLVLMVAGRGLAQMLTGGQILTFHDPLLEYLDQGRPGWLPMPMPFLLGAALLVLTCLATRRAPLGLLIESVGSNPEAARLSGVRAGPLVVGCYVWCAACAGLAGLIAGAGIKAADPFNTGRNAELAAIFAVVVGGTSLLGGRFSLAGAFVGGMLMQGLTTTMYARDIRSDVAPLPQALLILTICAAGAPRARALARRLAGRPRGTA